MKFIQPDPERSRACGRMLVLQSGLWWAPFLSFAGVSWQLLLGFAFPIFIYGYLAFTVFVFVEAWTSNKIYSKKSKFVEATNRFLCGLFFFYALLSLLGGLTD